MSDLAERLQSDFVVEWLYQWGGVMQAADDYTHAVRFGADASSAVAALEAEAVRLAAFEKDWTPLLASSGDAALYGMYGLTMALRRAALNLAALHDPDYVRNMPQVVHDGFREERVPALLEAAVRHREHFGGMVGG